jgi:pyruvate formate lyase activating enzyme
MYRLTDLSPTPVDTLRRARERAMGKGLNFVYVGNAVTEDGMNTRCPQCGEILVKREGYEITNVDLRDGCCGNCSTPVAGVWEGMELE